MKLNYFGKLKKENGKLVHVKDADRKTYEAFINMIPEGTVVEFFAEVQMIMVLWPSLLKFMQWLEH